MQYNGRMSFKDMNFSGASIGLSAADNTFNIAMRHPATGKPIFIFSDPSHWMKKARNAVESRLVKYYIYDMTFTLV